MHRLLRRRRRCWCGRRWRRCRWPPSGQRGGPQLDSEAIPLSEVIELANGNGHLHGLVLREVRRLEFTLLVQGAPVVVEAGVELPVEEVYVN
jgi:hypothetical protein